MSHRSGYNTRVGDGRLVVSGCAMHRIEAIRSCAELHTGLLVVSATVQAAKSLIRGLLQPGKSAVGVEPTTLYGLAQRLAVPILAAQGQVPIGHAAEVAVAARIVSKLHEEERLGRYEAIADKPGLARALARTLRELRMQGVTTEQVAKEAQDLALVFEAYEKDLEESRFADRAEVYRAASEAVARSRSLQQSPLILHDITIRFRAEEAFVSALADVVPKVIAVAPSLDIETIAALEQVLKIEAVQSGVAASTNLGRAQRHLFGSSSFSVEPDDTLEVFSAPGENREAVEIARRLLKQARRGVAFDQMAVVVRKSEQYRAHLAEALRRAGIAVNFAKGTRRPDPSGRALLALIDCSLSGLSASRFAEYLSLGVTPPVEAGGPPPPADTAGDRFRASEDYPGQTKGEEDNSLKSDLSGYASPRRWEKMLVDAAVLGGTDRWHRRLDGLESEFEQRIASFDDPDDPALAGVRARFTSLKRLRAFALPLIEELDALPERAAWGFWIDKLGAIASRAIREPGRVLQILSQLQPMAEVEDVPLLVVRHVLSNQLGSIVDPPSSDRQGAVLIATPDDIRGLVFEVVFVPGLAEKLFPPKVLEDPILLDRHRLQIDEHLATNKTRLLDERLALGIAIGACTKRLLVSYPRIDSDQARPRVPSFYALELFRAAEGRLPGFAELAARARDAGRVRMRWPAPEDASDAIDEAEFDLAVLEGLLHGTDDGAKGAARYLLETNDHLARALRFRGRRWLRKWTPADGLIAPSEEGQKELQGFLLNQRPYSATALQTFAACPYRFYLRAILRLQPREVVEPIEELDPMQRGSLVHDVHFRLLKALRDDKRLPLTEPGLEHAELLLEATLMATAGEYREKLAPAIEGVWVDGIALLEKDLKRWLRSRLNSDWVPEHFELAFGLPNVGERDASSRTEPVDLACGIQFRGSIDLVERDGGKIRATDYKTGKQPPNRALVIHGGEILQPVLYALALEKLFEDTEVAAGRLSYCTERGGFSEEIVPLDKAARAAADLVVETINESLESGFLPAAPREDACTWCDYQTVCGPDEEFRSGRKSKADLGAITHLRKQP